MATEVISALRSDAAWTANQTAMEALYGVGNYYTTASAWETAVDGNFVTDDEIHILECYNDWPSGLDDKVDLSGATTDATHYWVIRAADGEGHDGVPEAGFYFKKDTGSFSQVIKISDDYSRLENIQVINTSALSAAHGIVLSRPSNTLTNVIITGGTGSGSNGLEQQTDSPSYLDSCLAINSGADGFSFGNFDRSTLKNCGSAGNGVYGYVRSGTSGTLPTLINCWGFDNGTSDFPSTYHADSSNNASEDATAPGSSSVTGLTSADFTDTASDDYSPATGSDLIAAGTGSTPANDITGTAFESPRSIGPYEVAASAIVDITATGSINLGSSAALNATGKLAASSAIALSGFGGLNAVGSLVGTSSITFSNNATLSATGALSGVSALSFSSTANLNAVGRLTGSAPITFSDSATLNAVGSLQANSALSFGSVAELNAVGALVANSSITFTTGAELTQAGNFNLTSTAELSFGSVAGLTATGKLTANTGLSFTNSAVLNATGGLSAVSSLVFGSAAELTQATLNDIFATAGLAFGSAANISAIANITAVAPITLSTSALLSSPGVAPTVVGLHYTMTGSRVNFTMSGNPLHYTL